MSPITFAEVGARVNHPYSHFPHISLNAFAVDLIIYAIHVIYVVNNPPGAFKWMLRVNLVNRVLISTSCLDTSLAVQYRPVRFKDNSPA